MNRYRPRQSPRGWAVFDSQTDETLKQAPEHRTLQGAAAYSELLNDLEAVGRSPAVSAFAPSAQHGR